MTRNITLSSLKEWVEIDINPEIGFFGLYNMSFSSFEESGAPMYQIEYKFESRKGNGQVGRIDFLRTNNHGQAVFNKPFSLNNIIKLELRLLSNLASSKKKIKVEINYQEIDLINISDPLEKFENHFPRPENTKILFSAPYGHGKTTFLSLFFDKKKGEFNVFKVFPINYSVATNRDIFRYVKADLLFQLLSHDIEFDATKFNYIETLAFHAEDKLDHLVAPLALMLPDIGKVAYPVIVKLLKFKDDYFKFHKKAQIDDEEEVKKYINQVYEEEGSIFEDNFFTQIIRQMLEQLAIKESKQNVLIIEDLDRIDPDHMFRILNVVSAHYDLYSDGKENTNNKFGFDKIIAVCDYENIMNIFSHRYGENVDFGGYINKYFSISPFHYNNRDMMLSKLRELGKGSFGQDRFPSVQRSFELICYILIMAGVLSLRDILKIGNEGIVKTYLSLRDDQASFQDYHYTRLPTTGAIALLSKLGDTNLLKSKLLICESKGIATPKGLEEIIDILLLGASSKNGNEYQYSSAEYKYVCTIKENSDDLVVPLEISVYSNTVPVGQKQVKPVWNTRNFFEFLNINIEKYESMGFKV